MQESVQGYGLATRTWITRRCAGKDTLVRQTKAVSCRLRSSSSHHASNCQPTCEHRQQPPQSSYNCVEGLAQNLPGISFVSEQRPSSFLGNVQARVLSRPPRPFDHLGSGSGRQLVDFAPRLRRGWQTPSTNALSRRRRRLTSLISTQDYKISMMAKDIVCSFLQAAV